VQYKGVCHDSQIDPLDVPLYGLEKTRVCSGFTHEQHDLDWLEGVNNNVFCPFAFENIL